MNTLWLATFALVTLPALSSGGGTSCTVTQFETCAACTPQVLSGTVKLGAVAVSGATVELFTGSQGFVNSTTTNGVGYYEFNAEDMTNQCGNYFVSIAGISPIQPDWVQVAPADFAAVAVVRDTTPVEIHFKFAEGACLAGSDKKEILTTGYNRDTNTPFNIDWSMHPTGFGPVDPFWTMTQEATIQPGTSTACDTLQEPIPAKTRKEYSTAWHRYSDAEWLSAYDDDGINGFHAYTHCFCLNEGFVRSEADLQIELLVDDDMTIISNGQAIWDSRRCIADGRANNLAHPSRMFHFGAHYPYPPGNDASTWNVAEWRRSLRVGTNCLTFQVNNNGGVVTGWALKGAFKVPKGQCCVDAKPEPNPCRAVYHNKCFKGCKGVCSDDDTSAGGITAIVNNTKLRLPQFSEMDTDGNNFISRDEANEHASHLFLGFAEITRGRRNELSTEKNTAEQTELVDTKPRIVDRFVDLDVNGDGFISPHEFPALNDDVVGQAHIMASNDDKRCVPMNKNGEPMDVDVNPESAEWERTFSGKCDCPKPPPPPPEPCCNAIFSYTSLGHVFKKCEGECEERGERCRPIAKDGTQMDMSLYDPTDAKLVERFNRLFGKCDCQKPVSPPPPPPECEATLKKVIVSGQDVQLQTLAIMLCTTKCTRDDGATDQCVPVDRETGTLLTYDPTNLESVLAYNKSFTNNRAICDCPKPPARECSEIRRTTIVVEGDIAIPDVPICAGVCSTDAGTARCLPTDKNGDLLEFDQSSAEALMNYVQRFSNCTCPKTCVKKPSMQQCRTQNADGSITTHTIEVPLCSGKCKNTNGETDECEPLDGNGNQIREDFGSCERIKLYLNQFEKCGCPPVAPPPPPPRECEEYEKLPHPQDPDVLVPTCTGKCKLLATSDLTTQSVDRCKRYTINGDLIPDSATADEINARFHHCDCLRECPTSYMSIDTGLQPPNPQVIHDFPVCRSTCRDTKKCQAVDENDNVLTFQQGDADSMRKYYTLFHKCKCPEDQQPEPCQPVFEGGEAKCPGECVDDAMVRNKCTMVDLDGNQLNPLIITPQRFARLVEARKAKCGCPSCRFRGINRETFEVTSCTRDVCPETADGVVPKCVPSPGFFAPQPGRYQCNCVSP
eukprot:m.331406 g.331406  ORF g.331406 m.331406 type:complete len:1123 (+) comp16721_c0_seq1:140-3508(+)